MTAAGDVLNAARSLLGIRERPDGSNNAEPVTTWYPMRGAWCAMSASWALWKAGYRGIKFAWCPTGVANFQNGKWGTWHTSDPKPGDLCFYSFGGLRPDHVGIVEVPRGERMTTLEGNVGNAHKRLDRAAVIGRSGLIGFGRPRYAGTSSPVAGQPTATGGDRTLAVGTSGPDVVGLQRILIGAGLLPKGTDDGVFGAQTRAALIRLQEQLKVPADGVAGPVTRKAIDDMLRFVAASARPPASKPTATGPVLRRGARGDAVKRLQRRLEAHGHELGRIDGVFGGATDRAVRAFQRSKRLTQDGVVGPRTWAALG